MFKNEPLTILKTTELFFGIPPGTSKHWSNDNVTEQPLRISGVLFRIEEIQKKHRMEKCIEFFTSRSGTGSRSLNIFWGWDEESESKGIVEIIDGMEPEFTGVLRERFG